MDKLRARCRGRVRRTAEVRPIFRMCTIGHVKNKKPLDVQVISPIKKHEKVTMNNKYHCE